MNLEGCLQGSGPGSCSELGVRLTESAPQSLHLAVLALCDSGAESEVAAALEKLTHLRSGNA